MQSEEIVVFACDWSLVGVEPEELCCLFSTVVFKILMAYEGR